MTYCALDRNGLGLRPGAYAGCVATSLFRLHAVLFFSSSCFNVLFFYFHVNYSAMLVLCLHLG